MLPRSALARTRLGLQRIATAAPAPRRQLSSLLLATTKASIPIVVDRSNRLSLARRYASAAVAEKPEEEEDFFASDIIPNAVLPEASKATRAESPTPQGQIDDPGPSDPSQAATPRAETMPFTSLKGKVNHNTLKALTIKPFQLTAMSEVQKRVLSLMPELSGGKSAKVEEGAEEEVVRTNALGEKVSSAARGKHDLLVKAKTGTGKTIAFLVPAIESRLNQLEKMAKSAEDKHAGGQARRGTAKSSVGALIISPTRELATQIANEAIKVCQWNKELNVRLFVGGMPRYQQLKDFQRNRKDILVATPGRMKDLLSEPEVRDAVADAQMLILDEADTLLEMGFSKDLNHIISAMPAERQTFLFSATVSPEIRQVARKSLKQDHIFIDCVPKNETNVHTHIPQYYHPLSSAAEQIPETLKLIAQDQMENPDSKIILFLPTTKATMLWATLLRELNNTLPNRTQVHEIHSGLEQRRRSRASDNFRQDRRPSVLVTSDVSARGVDYPGVTRVIQVGCPSSAEQYIHRVGRTGRGGKSGGRGDLVLLPFEHGFANHLLPKIPIKRVDAKQTAESLSQLFSADQLQAIDTQTRELLPTLDPEAIREVYTSYLGYYSGRTDVLNLKAYNVYEGLQEWATGAAGLEQPPHLSAMLLAKLGFGKPKPKFGFGGGGGGGAGPRPGGSFGKRSSFGASGGRGAEGGWGEARSRDRDSMGGGSRNFERRDRKGGPPDRRDKDGGFSKRSWSDRGSRGF